MTIEAIAELAFKPTTHPTRIQITFKNTTTAIGYFDGNRKGNELYLQNKWLFVIVPQHNNKQDKSTFIGDDIASIQEIQISGIS